MLISVVIPTHNEAVALPGLLGQLNDFDIGEVIVVDGGSTDGTQAIAEAHSGVRLIQSEVACRAVQMNLGAAAATGGAGVGREDDVLVFLHADSVLPASFRDDIVDAVGRTVGFAAGAFRLRIDSRRWPYRLIERVVHWRSVGRSLPYGDQGIFLRRRMFEAVGGYPEIPIMEDYELMHRLRRRGRVVIVDSPITTSARRWESRGVWRTTLLHQRCIVGYRLGVSPERIARWRG